MDFEFPQLLNPTDNEPYILVTDEKDVLKSKLLTARQFSQGAGGKADLVVIKDFLQYQISVIIQETQQKSPHQLILQMQSLENWLIILIPNIKPTKTRCNPRQTHLSNLIKNCKKDMIMPATMWFPNQSKVLKVRPKMWKKHLSLYNKFQRVILNRRLQSQNQKKLLIKYYYSNISKISDLRAAPELPEYLFSTTKKLRAWRQAPNELCVWNKTKEQFYRNNLESTLNQELQDRSELALKFWNQQIKSLGDQFLNILSEDSSLQQQNFVSLNIETAEAFALLLNTMITPETRIVLHIGDFNQADSKSIAESISRLTSIVNLSIKWNVTNKAQGLSHIAQAIGQAEQLKVLTFEFSSNVQANQAKDFFAEFKEVKLPNLEEVNVVAEQSNINSAVQHVAKALKSVGGAQVSRVSLNFSQSQVDNKSAQQLGDALSTYKGVKKLSLNFSGFSLNSNNIKDDGFIGLIQHVPNFSSTLIELNINVGRNQLTDGSLAALNKQFQSVKWSALKAVNISAHYNKITEEGARKLGKFLHGLPILVNLQLNLNSTEINQKGLSFIINQLGPQVSASIQAKQTHVTKEEAAELQDKVASLSI
ncbi:unnamed protein product (macronuclear) [Paramecium tetraurelia]|uniref:Uncharacterized protein n=1 Tax=Paramecium tetraurelia TaxID=5888 RepID=A0BXQ8_PARTE|nr:uncharacterized protein GSPATT00033178001 [Paramecium tetraurelia]CAK63325.1 unnamed protein product [Paramecium tetraurelia]|eukprot:XP_001430723.1 hypothetical protein (macronuclear) [Paramecium tetraurelia strain d4-2]